MENLLFLEQALADELERIMEEDPAVVLLTADVGRSIFKDEFLEEHKDSIYNFGIAEQNMISAAAGMAVGGLKPVVLTFASFLCQRALDQIIQSIAYPQLNVKMIGLKAGLASSGGESHTSTQDLSIMRGIPNLIIFSPCGTNQTYKLTREMLSYEGPFYMRIRNECEALALRSNYDVRIGGGHMIHKGTDLTLISTGLMVARAMVVAKKLKDEGISARVIDLYSIKPFDREIIRKAAEETGRIITIEENNVLCGLGGLVAEYISEVYPCPVHRIGIEDQSGTSSESPAELLELFGLSSYKILEKVKSFL